MRNHRKKRVFIRKIGSLQQRKFKKICTTSFLRKSSCTQKNQNRATALWKETTCFAAKKKEEDSLLRLWEPRNTCPLICSVSTKENACFFKSVPNTTSGSKYSGLPVALQGAPSFYTYSASTKDAYTTTGTTLQL